MSGWAAGWVCFGLLGCRHALAGGTGTDDGGCSALIGLRLFGRARWRCCGGSVWQTAARLRREPGTHLSFLSARFLPLLSRLSLSVLCFLSLEEFSVGVDLSLRTPREWRDWKPPGSGHYLPLTKNRNRRPCPAINSDLVITPHKFQETVFWAHGFDFEFTVGCKLKLLCPRFETNSQNPTRVVCNRKPVKTCRTFHRVVMGLNDPFSMPRIRKPTKTDRKPETGTASIASRRSG